jgi:hypothetical protein
MEDVFGEGGDWLPDGGCVAVVARGAVVRADGSLDEAGGVGLSGSVVWDKANPQIRGIRPATRAVPCNVNGAENLIMW